MAQEQSAVREAAAARDLASSRVRRLTGVAVAAAATLTGIFAALAAGSTPAKKPGVVPRAPRSTVAKGPVAAPVPSLVSAQAGTGAPPAAAASTPSVQAPSAAPAAAAPVVVSGGS